MPDDKDKDKDPAVRDVPAEETAAATGLTESATPDALLYNEPYVGDPNVNPSIAQAAAEAGDDDEVEAKGRRGKKADDE